MNIKKQLQWIGDGFKKVVIHPVNPFTIDNPDILVLTNYDLIAIFYPKKSEIANPDLLLKRLYMSRLTLYSESKTVLILGEDKVHSIGNFPIMNIAFDLIIYNSDRNDVRSRLSCKIRQKNYIEPKIRSARLNIYWGLCDFYERHAQKSEGYVPFQDFPGLKIKSWSNPNKMIEARSITSDGDIFLASKKGMKPEFRKDFDKILTYTAMNEYNISNGILENRYKSSSYPFKMFNIQGYESIEKNPLFLNTLFFMGYYPGRFSEEVNVRALRDDYYAFMKNGKYFTRR